MCHLRKVSTQVNGGLQFQVRSQVIWNKSFETSPSLVALLHMEFQIRSHCIQNKSTPSLKSYQSEAKSNSKSCLKVASYSCWVRAKSGDKPGPNLSPWDNTCQFSNLWSPTFIQASDAELRWGKTHKQGNDFAGFTFKLTPPTPNAYPSPPLYKSNTGNYFGMIGCRRMSPVDVCETKKVGMREKGRYYRGRTPYDKRKA